MHKEVRSKTDSHREVGAPDNEPQLDQETLRKISGELDKHFPHTIDETELVLMEVSPHRLHAYWHISPWDLQTGSAKTGKSTLELVMRFHDLTVGSQRTNQHISISSYLHSQEANM